jgi:hypothetical protein
MLAAVTSSARTANGRFAPGHSGNPAGRPKGAVGIVRKLVGALRDSEDEGFHRVLIEAALAGNLAAARFCAARIDAAAAREAPGHKLLRVTRAEALNPFVLHARVVQALVEGEIAAEPALEILRALAAKKTLDAYQYFELQEAERAALAQEPGPASSLTPCEGGPGSGMSTAPDPPADAAEAADDERPADPPAEADVVAASQPSPAAGEGDAIVAAADPSGAAETADTGVADGKLAIPADAGDVARAVRSPASAAGDATTAAPEPESAPASAAMPETAVPQHRRRRVIWVHGVDLWRDRL